MNRQALLIVFAAVCPAVCAQRPPAGSQPEDPPLPESPPPSGDEKEFNTYNDDLVAMSRKVLTQVKQINDQYMEKLHSAICDKQQAFFTAGLEHSVPVCERVPAGFDKDVDCPVFTNSLGRQERKVLSSHCSDLLEEEYFYNLTMTYEKNLKMLQADTLSKLQQESEAVKAEFAMHLVQAEKAGARSLLQDAPAKKAAAKAKAGEPMAAWSSREREAWRAEVHDEAQAYAAAMTKIVSDLQRFRQETLVKVAADLNRTLGRARTVTRAELAQHNESWDCWAKLDSDVFDFTPWIVMHPGGRHLITDRCGTDVTNTWNHFHAAVGNLPGERRVGVWDVNEEIAATTAEPCAHQVNQEGHAVQQPDGRVVQRAIGTIADRPVSLAEEDESPSSPLSSEAFRARRTAVDDVAESVSSPLPLVRRAA